MGFSRTVVAALILTATVACGSSATEASPPKHDGLDRESDAASDAPPDAPTPVASCDGGSCIEHLVVIVQENHTFDNQFGGYCTAAPGSTPTCNDGPACCATPS